MSIDTGKISDSFDHEKHLNYIAKLYEPEVKKHLEKYIEYTFSGLKNTFVKPISENLIKCAKEIFGNIRDNVVAEQRDNRRTYELKSELRYEGHLEGRVLLGDFLFQAYQIKIIFYNEVGSFNRNGESDKNTICSSIFSHLSHRRTSTIYTWGADNVYLYGKGPSIQEYTPDSNAIVEKQWDNALNGRRTDIIFLVEGKEIHAHKTILSITSDYFDSLFHSGMSESKKEKIEIKDYPYAVFQMMLKFVYTGVVDKTQVEDIGLIVQLFALANEYALDHLVKLCNNIIKSYIQKNGFEKDDNFTTILQLGLNFSHDEFIHTALNYAEDNELGRVLLLSYIDDNGDALPVVIDKVIEFNEIKQEYPLVTTALLKKSNDKRKAKTKKSFI